MTATVSLSLLPDEIILHILSYLDVPAPSAINFNEDPSLDLTDSTEQPLKTLSLVSQGWRALVIPILFSHFRIWAPSDCPVVRINEEPEEPYQANGSAIPHITEFSDSYEDLARSVRSLVVRDDRIATQGDWQSMSAGQLKHFWDDVVKAFPRLTRIVIAAPPCTVSLWAGLHSPTASAGWAFDMPYHYLELCADDDRDPDWQSYKPIYQRRSWTHLSFNEGSFVKAYGTYEYWWLHPPSALERLSLNVGASAFAYNHPDSPLYNQWHWRTPQLKTFSYRAVFPHEYHLKRLVRKYLPSFRPGLKTVSFNIAPSPAALRDLDDRVAQGRLDAQDLWQEHARGLRVLMEGVMEIGGFSISAGEIRNGLTTLVHDASDDLHLEEYSEKAPEWHREDTGQFIIWRKEPSEDNNDRA